MSLLAFSPLLPWIQMNEELPAKESHCVVGNQTIGSVRESERGRKRELYIFLRYITQQSIQQQQHRKSFDYWLAPTVLQPLSSARPCNRYDRDKKEVEEKLARAPQSLARYKVRRCVETGDADEHKKRLEKNRGYRRGASLI